MAAMHENHVLVAENLDPQKLSLRCFTPTLSDKNGSVLWTVPPLETKSPKDTSASRKITAVLPLDLDRIILGLGKR